MNAEFNPFLTDSYISKDLFCDREYELETLKKRIENQTNTTLISARRLGKSALIWRLFDEFDAKDRICIYIDIYATQTLKDLIEILAAAILKHFPEKKSIGKKFLDVLKGFRPIITYDSLTGQPAVHFEFAQAKEGEQTLGGLLQFLDEQKIKILIAIDEFQQVAAYSEQNTEAVLRTAIQLLKNINFIFSGSNKHLMTEIFTSSKRPFFSSTLMLGLSTIPEDKYKSFILQKFTEKKRAISEMEINFIIEWTRCHTYYTQMVCKEVFATQIKKIDIDVVKKVCSNILTSQQLTYIQYRSLLTSLQWQLLIAIAKEGKLYNPQSANFLQKYKVGSASSVKKALDALIDKEMVYRNDDIDTTSYQVYDVFLSRWLERTY